MIEHYTRYVNGNFQQATRRRFSVIDHMTCFAKDNDEYNETVYAFRFKVFPEYINRNLAPSVNAKTQTLANEAVMDFIRSTGLFDFEKGSAYGNLGQWRMPKPITFKDIFDERGCGCFVEPAPGNEIDLVWDDRRLISLDQAKEHINTAFKRLYG